MEEDGKLTKGMGETGGRNFGKRFLVFFLSRPCKPLIFLDLTEKKRGSVDCSFSKYCSLFEEAK